MSGHPIHPIVVHFPIALLFTAVFFELLGLLIQQEQYRQFGFWLLVLGLAGGVVAAAFGFWSEEMVEKMGVPEEAVDRHEFFAIATLIVFGLLLIFRRWARHRWSARNKTIYFTMAMLGLLLLGTTGFFGGELVYRYGAGVQKPTSGTPGSSGMTTPSNDAHDKN